MKWISVIAGLGNPGQAYQYTRHNVGFEWIDQLATQVGAKWKSASCAQASVAEWMMDQERIWLIKPSRFMNASGIPLFDFLQFYKIPCSQLLVAYDEVSLPEGNFKISMRGGDGGHNGIKSLHSHVGIDFVSLRIGVGQKAHPEMILTDHVLGKFTPEQWKSIQSLFPTLNQATETIIHHGPEKAMNQFNRKTTIYHAKQTQLPGNVHPEHPQSRRISRGADSVPERDAEES